MVEDFLSTGCDDGLDNDNGLAQCYDCGNKLDKYHNHCQSSLKQPFITTNKKSITKSVPIYYTCNDWINNTSLN